MRRRQFIAGLGSAAAWPLAARAQFDRVRRIGVLMWGEENDPVWKPRLSGFTQALADLGWIDGRNVRMDLRWAGADSNLLRALAQELVGLQGEAGFIPSIGGPAFPDARTPHRHGWRTAGAIVTRCRRPGRQSET
jgi:putative tryptophan/tyrosine transport system substrate-binding protein